MSWISTLMQNGRKQQKRNSMRAIEDLYDEKTLSLNDYVELKGNLLNGDYAAYRDALGDVLSQITESSSQYTTLEALHIKAQQLARYKEQVEQRGGEGDGDEDEEAEDPDDDDDEEEGSDNEESDDAENEKAREDLEKLQATMRSSQPQPQSGGGRRFASAPFGPDYTPRYKQRTWR